MLQPSVNNDYTRGIRLLRELGGQEVAINRARIRKAAYHRMLLLFSGGRSGTRRNRVLRYRNHESLGEMVNRVNEAIGEQLFSADEVEMKMAADAKKHAGRMLEREKEQMIPWQAVRRRQA